MSGEETGPVEPARPAPVQRISPITFPTEPIAAPKPPPDAPPSVRDAFRETGFALGAEVRWLADALNLQRKIAGQSGHSKLRNRRFASALLFWSRVHGAGIDLLALTAGASYGSCLPLLRSAFEWLGAEQAVVGEEQAEFEDWLRGDPQGGWGPHPQLRATDVAMGQYMAGQQIAMSEETGAAYRAAAELARSHFGPSALLSAAESHDKRLAVSWAEPRFHHGWAQLLFGWQRLLQDRQCRFAVGAGLFGVEAEDRAEYQRLHRLGAEMQAAPGRCTAEWILDGGRQRLLIENFRRQPAGAPKRILL